MLDIIDDVVNIFNIIFYKIKKGKFILDKFNLIVLC